MAWKSSILAIVNEQLYLCNIGISRLMNVFLPPTAVIKIIAD